MLLYQLQQASIISENKFTQLSERIELYGGEKSVICSDGVLTGIKVHTNKQNKATVFQNMHADIESFAR